MMSVSGNRDQAAKVSLAVCMWCGGRTSQNGVGPNILVTGLVTSYGDQIARRCSNNNTSRLHICSGATRCMA